ncbi:hypothetical protein HOG98_08440 [bacterium]|jgi:hypothetical protein|nr:hypothetical protein [bacterium]
MKNHKKHPQMSRINKKVISSNPGNKIFDAWSIQYGFDKNNPEMNLSISNLFVPEILLLISSNSYNDNETAAFALVLPFLKNDEHVPGQLEKQIESLSSSTNSIHRYTASLCLKNLMLYLKDNSKYHFQHMIFDMAGSKRSKHQKVAHDALVCLTSNIEQHHYENYRSLLFNMARSGNSRTRQFCAEFIIEELIGVPKTTFEKSVPLNKFIIETLSKLSYLTESTIKDTFQRTYVYSIDKANDENTSESISKFEQFLSLRTDGQHILNGKIVPLITKNGLSDKYFNLMLSLTKSKSNHSKKLAFYFLCYSLTCPVAGSYRKGMGYIAEVLGDKHHDSVSLALLVLDKLRLSNQKLFWGTWDNLMHGLKSNTLCSTISKRINATKNMDAYLNDELLR